MTRIEELELDEMKPLDLTKQVQTVDGRKVRILCTDRKNNSGWMIVGLVEQQNGVEDIACWTKDGTFSLSGGRSSYDLVNVPEVLYMNAYPRGVYASSQACESRKQADETASTDRIACVRFTVGQFDD